MNQNRLKNIKEYLQQMIILYKDFHTQIIELLNTIELVGKDNLSFLQIKLDFNNYYSFSEKEKEEKKNKEIAEKINKEERQKILSEHRKKYKNEIEEDLDIEDNNNINNTNNINNNMDSANGSLYEKSSNKYEYTLKKNDNSNDEGDDDNNNISGIKLTKKNNIRIITKRKEQNKNIIKSNNNDVLDLNNQINGSNNVQKGYLTKHDLKGEIINNYTDYLNEGLDDTTTNNQIDKSQPSIIYNHKSITKTKPETRLHLDKQGIEEEEEIVTEVKPKIYGIATKTVPRKNNLDDDE